MTSNVGSEFIMNENLTDKEIENKIDENLHRFFRPEFLNRIDERVVFKKLSQENITDIVNIQMERLLKRIRDQGIDLKWDKKATSYLAKKAYDPNFGARPLKRVIQKEIINELSKKLLSGEINKEDQLKITANDLGLEFKKSK